MPIKLSFKPLTLNFKFAAGTSRGVLTKKTCWILKIHQSDKKYEYGLGEVAPLERLSLDWAVDMPNEFGLIKEKLEQFVLPENQEAIYDLVKQIVPNNLPSIKFGLETALLDLLHGGIREVFTNDFFNAKYSIPINGLVWMGEKDFMKKQIDEKIALGFKCIKIKIGAIDFDQELELLEYIRTNYSQEDLIIRVDANGAFSTQKALFKLKALESFQLHSIEQPIMPRQRMSMQLICAKSGVPIALDEELIGVDGKSNKEELLDDIKPSYIILKPSLLGGFRETKEWIELADEKGIGWWITSALESNIGLNAICQFTANYKITMHQGLGTGMLYENNVSSPLTINGEFIYYDKDASWSKNMY